MSCTLTTVSAALHAMMGYDTEELVARARVERTQNISFMFVTLDVSKPKGWLNADADCRESKGGHAVRGEVYQSAGGRRRATAVQAVCRVGRDCRSGSGHGEERT